jgi:dipeptidyl aminopeptidase/acylaminoacyl peptidase
MPESDGPDSKVEAALDLLDGLRTPSQIAFHHGGTAIAATISPATRGSGESYQSRIWSFPLDGTPPQPLTNGPGSDSLPSFSPVNGAMAFVSDRNETGRNALFLRHDETIFPLGVIPGSIESLCWTADGTALLVLVADRGLDVPATDGAVRLWWGEAEEPEVTASHRARRRLFRVQRATGEVAEIGPSDHTVWEFAPIGSDSVLALVSADSSERGWYHAQLARISCATQAMEILHRSSWQLQGPAVDPTGRYGAFIEGWSSDRGLLAGDIRVIDLDSGQVRALAEGRLSDVVSLQWRNSNSLWFAGWSGLGTMHGVVHLDGVVQDCMHEAAIIGPTPYFAQVLPFPDGGDLIGVREAANKPPEVSIKRKNGEWNPLTALNIRVTEGFPGYPEMREIEWAGLGGLAMQGLLLLPQGWHKAGPLLVDVHGGPTASVKTGFNPGSALPLVAAGFAVFLPNYRGSAGRGQDFTRLNVGDPGGAEFRDILLGLDWCIAQGIADPRNIGITGASYGGYLTAWAVATTSRFSAAVMVSGIVDHWSCHYSANHDFAEFIMGGPLSIEANRRLAVDRSPLSRLDRPTTPTLIIHGREDRCTPVGQAHQFYNALLERGGVAELAIYPREGHGLHETAHRRDAWRRTIAWFNQYLRNEG